MKINKKNNLGTNNSNIGFYIGGIVLTITFFISMYAFFEKSAMASKMLAAGGSILLLVLVIPFWVKMFTIHFID